MSEGHKTKDSCKNSEILPNHIIVPKVDHNHITSSKTIFLFGIIKYLFGSSFNNNLFLSIDHDVFRASTKWEEVEAVVVYGLSIDVDPVRMKHVLAAKYIMNGEPNI